MGRASAAAAAAGTASGWECVSDEAAGDVIDPLLAAARRAGGPSPRARLMIAACVSSRMFRSHLTTMWVRQSRM